MIGEFAVLAYPAKYRGSSIMSFMVSFGGRGLRKRLGPESATKAKNILSFDP